MFLLFMIIYPFYINSLFKYDVDNLFPFELLFILIYLNTLAI